MEDSAPLYQSRNFIFRYPSNSIAEKQIHLIATRLQSVLYEAVNVLDLELPQEPIHVYLSEMEEVELPAHAQGNGGTTQPGRMEIQGIYRSDSPGLSLERSLVELLVRVNLEERASQPAMVVDGLLGHISLQIGRLDSAKPKASLSEALNALPMCCTGRRQSPRCYTIRSLPNLSLFCSALMA
jgi:hypothetical protein